MSNYYPPAAFHFELSFNGLRGKDAGFQEVSGIKAEVDVQEIKEGGENRFVRRLPGRIKYPNLVLKRGMMVSTTALFTWIRTMMESGIENPIQPKEISVELLGPEGDPLMRWDFVNAWPVKWEVGKLDAKANEVAVETLEFAYDYYTTTASGEEYSTMDLFGE